MFPCRKCGKETPYENGFCFGCYHEWKIDHDHKYGLRSKEYTYHYNMIKGRIGETLIQELFLASNFDVFHYGMESTIPGVMELLHGIKTEVAQEIRRMPDFVVRNPITNTFYFVEVKFSASGIFSRQNMDKDYPYHNAYFIVVSKTNIKCLTYKELEQGQVIDSESNNYLVNRKEFDFNESLVTHFSQFAEIFFANV